jgi:outer membrane biosynthesis protein TonB
VTRVTAVTFLAKPPYLTISSLEVDHTPLSEVIDIMPTRHLLALLLLFYSFGSAGTAQSQQTTTDTSRKIVRKLAPTYPDIARKMNLGGTVKVVAVVAADGAVKAVEPKGGSPILLKAAEDAVAQWKFASGGESKEVIEVRFAP